jgi:hypothetical protein
MAYNIPLADRIREFLSTKPDIKVEEKKMFRGLTFMVNDKMCVGVSNEHLMCRFDPTLQNDVAERNGYLPRMMKEKEYLGYCYVSVEGYQSNRDFDYWMHLCLEYNPTAKAAKKKK